MLPFDEALRKVLALARPVATERVPTARASGRVLAEALVAAGPLPATDHSAMDGYAVATRWLVEGARQKLPVVGESKTGRLPPALSEGSACRIFTGAPLPDGADAVVMQEDVERTGDVITFEARPLAGQHVRRAGEDLAAGAVALDRGVRLDPYHLGLAAALDRAHLHVASRPVVTVICTGDELRAAGDAPFPGSIPESNGVSVAAMVAAAGGAPRIAPLVRDDASATQRAIAAALDTSDVVVTVGGVSVGDYDVVRPALEAAGATLELYAVRIKPGKPLTVGRRGRAVVLGLPGNPVSAQVTFALFGMPLLRAMQGDARPVPARVTARLGAPIAHKAGRLGFYRAVLADGQATPLANQSSGAATSMAWANALVVAPEDANGLDAGAEVACIVLSDL